MTLVEFASIYLKIYEPRCNEENQSEEWFKFKNLVKNIKNPNSLILEEDLSFLSKHLRDYVINNWYRIKAMAV